jgi:hypothetical protein
MRETLNIPTAIVAFQYSKFHVDTWRAGEKIRIENTVRIRALYDYGNRTETRYVVVDANANDEEVHRQTRLAVGATPEVKITMHKPPEHVHLIQPSQEPRPCSHR